MDFLDEEKHKLSKHAALVQEIYEDRCLHPSKNNILNCIYELQPAGLASLIHKYWNEEDAIFGNRIRTVQTGFFGNFTDKNARNYFRPTPEKIVGPSGLILKPVTCLLMTW